VYSIFSMASDFSSDELVEYVEHAADAGPASFAPTGDLVFHEGTAAERGNILRFPPGDDGAVEYVVRTPFNERDGMVSPNGRWLAYTSDRSDANEVYVEPFPGGGPRTQVSNGGGSLPRWAPGGEELFYVNRTQMIAVSVTTEPEITITGERQVLFESDTYLNDWGYDVDRNAQRFLMVQKGAEDELELRSRQHINLIFNWFDELERLVPTD